MSKEKQCECCHEWWYDSDVKGNLCPNCYDYFKQLKRQLEEKDKEIEKLKQELEETNAGYDFTYEQSSEAIKELKQNQTKLAIQELEKVKEEMDLNGNSYCEIRQGTSPHNPTDYAWFNYVKFRNYLNQQIKELKGEK